jgi:phosphatidylglycerol phospholipase C
MLHVSLFGPTGSSFLRAARAADRAVFAWTVNDEKRMQWGISKELDGIVTDDPKKFLDLCKDWRSSQKPPKFGVGEMLKVFQMQVMIIVFGFYLRWKFGAQWGASVKKEFRVKLA